MASRSLSSSRLGGPSDVLLMAVSSRPSCHLFSLSLRSRRPSPGVVLCAAPKPAETETKARVQRGITKPRPVSPEMQALLGVSEIPRTQALKLIWAYIKHHNLQDPENKKIIVCDEKLKTIFAGRERVGFLEISGLINPHFLK